MGWMDGPLNASLLTNAKGGKTGKTSKYIGVTQQRGDEGEGRQRTGDKLTNSAFHPWHVLSSSPDPAA